MLRETARALPDGAPACRRHAGAKLTPDRFPYIPARIEFQISQKCEIHAGKADHILRTLIE
jgi:hypothetical protein